MPRIMQYTFCCGSAITSGGIENFDDISDELVFKLHFKPALIDFRTDLAKVRLIEDIEDDMIINAA